MIMKDTFEKMNYKDYKRQVKLSNVFKKPFPIRYRKIKDILHEMVNGLNKEVVNDKIIYRKGNKYMFHFDLYKDNKKVYMSIDNVFKPLMMLNLEHLLFMEVIHDLVNNYFDHGYFDRDSIHFIYETEIYRIYR